MKRVTGYETVNTILGGDLTVIQPGDGYRFSIDAILLGRFVSARRHERVLELGAGCGVVSVMIAALYHPHEVIALELQPDLADIAARNAALNGLPMMRSLCADLRSRRIDGLDRQSCDLVVANPPYRAIRTGRESPNLSRRIARGESGATLAQFVEAAARYAKFRGRIAFVYTARRSAELIALLRSHSLEPKRIRFVHPTITSSATTVLLEARNGGGLEVKIEPPLILYSEPGVYTEEAREILRAPGRRRA